MASRYTSSMHNVSQKNQVKSTTHKGNVSIGRSGSESGTDASGTTETLSAEEEHTLRHTQRQDPQGQEQTPINTTTITVSSHLPLLEAASQANSIAQSNQSNLSVGSNRNTLIIHHSIPDEPWSNRWLSTYTNANSGRNSRERSLQPVSSTQTTFVNRISNKHSETVASSSSVIGTTVLNSSRNISTRPSADNSSLSSSEFIGNISTYLTDPVFSHSLAAGSSPKFMSNTEITDIPSSYLDQSEVLKHLISNDSTGNENSNYFSSFSNNDRNFNRKKIDQNISSSNSIVNRASSELGNVSNSTSYREDSDISVLLKRLPPPPAYTNWNADGKSILSTKDNNSGPSHRSMEKNILSKSQPDLTRVRGVARDPNLVLDQQKPIPRLSGGLQVHSDEKIYLKEMIDYLTRENRALKLELDIYHRKVAKLQKIEIEMTKVGEQHEALVKLCERREQLERLARHKLHSEVQRLTELNNDLKEQNDIFTNQMIIQPTGLDGNSEFASFKRELSKRDLAIAQLVSQNKELISAKETLIIENTAQKKTLKEQRAHIDVLDTALTNSQTSILKLEEEIHQKQNVAEQAGQLKRLLLSMKHATDRREQSEKNLRQKLEMDILQLKSSTKMDCYTSELYELRQELRDKEEKIMMLESDVIKWEQRLLQDSAMKHITCDTSLISRNQSLESQLREKEAELRSLHKQTTEKEQPFEPTILSNSSMGVASKIDGNVSQMTVISPSYAYSSPSISTSSSTSSQLNVHTFPTPRRDEELGIQGFIPLAPTRNQQTNVDYSGGVLHLEHNSSGSYCCYVSADDTEVTVQEPETLHFEKVHSGGNLLSHLICNQQSSCRMDEDFPSESVPNLAGKQLSKHIQPAESPSNIQSSSKVYATNFQMKTNNSSSIQQLQMNNFLNHSHQTMPLTSEHANLCLPLEKSNGNNECPSPMRSSSFVTESHSVRGDPPPYYSQHQVCIENQKSQVIQQPQIQPPLSSPSLQNQASSLSLIQSIPTSKYDNSVFKSPAFSPAVTVCQRPHPPNVFCHTCQSVRRSHRQNAAALVRRANSSGCQHNRRSAPSPSSSCDSLDDAPSILERLKKEWEMGILCGPPASKAVKANGKSDGSKTLPPHALGLKSLINHESNQHKKDFTQCFMLENKPLDAQNAGRNDKINIRENEESNSPSSIAVCPVTPITAKHVDNKKDVTHLDRALNRLSMKRNSSQSVPRYSLKSYVSEGTGPALGASDLHNENFSRTDNLEFTNRTAMCDSYSQNQMAKIKMSSIEQENFKNSNNIELIILEDSDLKIRSNHIDLGSDIQNVS